MRQRSRDSERKKRDKGRTTEEQRELSGLLWAPVPFWRVPYL